MMIFFITIKKMQHARQSENTGAVNFAYDNGEIRISLF